MKEEEEFSLAVAPRRAVKTIYKMMNIDELHFYPDNPRISSVVMEYKKEDLTDELIYAKMEEKQKDACNTLYQEVKKDGQINEPLIICQNQAIEGNTRLWVAKTLYKETKLNQWKSVPCRVVEGILEPIEIDYILCNYHIRKKKDWIPFEQACYFYRMQSEEHRSTKEISDLTGEGQNKINDYIRTFREMKSRGADKDQFSHYYEAIKETEVKKAIKNGVPVLDVVERGLKKGEIKDAKDVRKLKKILPDKVATKKLIQDKIDIYRAEKIAVTRNPAQDDEFLSALVDIKTMLEHTNIDKIKAIKENPRKLKIVQEFLDSVKLFSRIIHK